MFIIIMITIIIILTLLTWKLIDSLNKLNMMLSNAETKNNERRGSGKLRSPDKKSNKKKFKNIYAEIDVMQKKIQNIDSFILDNMELFCERLYNLKKETDDRFTRMDELTISYENIFKQISSHIPIRF